MKVLISLISIYSGFALAGTPGGNCVVQWKNYNNQPALPNGLMVGQSWDGEDVYVGRGTYSYFDEDTEETISQTAPGDIKLGDWFYMTYAGTRRHITSGVDYLKVIGDCCEFVTYAPSQQKPYVIVHSEDDGYDFLITKHELSYTCSSDPTGCDYVTIGKFLPSVSEAYYSNKDGVEQRQTSGPFKALACDVAVAPPPA